MTIRKSKFVFSQSLFVFQTYPIIHSCVVPLKQVYPEVTPQIKSPKYFFNGLTFSSVLSGLFLNLRNYRPVPYILKLQCLGLQILSSDVFYSHLSVSPRPPTSRKKGTLIQLYNFTKLDLPLYKT